MKNLIEERDKAYEQHNENSDAITAKKSLRNGILATMVSSMFINASPAAGLLVKQSPKRKHLNLMAAMSLKNSMSC